MPGRDPEARERSATVAAEVRAVMREKGLTGAGLREALEKAGHVIPNDMWVSRRTTGDVNLVQPVKVVYGPTDDLTKIADVLGVSADRFVRVLNSKASKSRKTADGDQPADAKPADAKPAA